MKQHIKTHRLDPEDMKAAISNINIDLTAKESPMARLKLPLPNFPDNGLNMTH